MRSALPGKLGITMPTIRPGTTAIPGSRPQIGKRRGKELSLVVEIPRPGTAASAPTSPVSPAGRSPTSPVSPAGRSPTSPKGGCFIWEDLVPWEGKMMNYLTSTGERYTGGWREGCPHGVGKCEYTTGDLYEGEWVLGRWEVTLTLTLIGRRVGLGKVGRQGILQKRRWGGVAG